MKKSKKSLKTSTFLKRRSIQVKIGVAIILFTTLALSGYGAYQYRTQQVRARTRLEIFAQNVAGQLALNLIVPLWDYDFHQARRVVEAEMQDNNILAIRIVNSGEDILVAKGRDEEWNIIDRKEDIIAELPPITAEIVRGDAEKLGTVEVFMTQRFVEAELREALREIGAIVIGLDVSLFLLLILSLQQLLIHPLKRVLAFANAMADGDFRQEIEIRQRDEIGELAESFLRMKDAVARVIQQVQSASAEVATGSQQLRDNAAKMSERGTQQAASTEEVSSAMEEMLANINQNADNAKQTEQIATKASRDAKEGGEAVTKAVEAIKSIAQKVSVIEEISNRTHMLSMNASIEASKAQEYGKGFAVVATEVRTLASQTQNAAKEINSLAHTTVELAEKAGDLLTRLVPDIQHTAELVQEISGASQEQQSGARQVNMAVQQLDSISQEYALISEQTSTTAEELTGQAEQLRKMTDFFKLPEGNTVLRGVRKQHWTQLLEAIDALGDDSIREHLLLGLGEVMAESLPSQAPEKSEGAASAEQISKERKGRESVSTPGEQEEVSPFVSENENYDGSSKLDEAFERY